MYILPQFVRNACATDGIWPLTSLTIIWGSALSPNTYIIEGGGAHAPCCLGYGCVVTCVKSVSYPRLLVRVVSRHLCIYRCSLVFKLKF